MNLSLTRKMSYIVAALAVGFPIVIMFWSLKAGIPTLLIGLFIALQAIRMGGQPDALKVSDGEMQRIARQQSDRGRTILVQLVDDYGRDLPEQTQQRLIEAAEARANPRDTVMGVHYVLPKEEPK